MTCKSWDGSAEKREIGKTRMADLGFGWCLHEPRGTYRPPHWTCDKHRPADAVTAGHRERKLRAQGHIA